MKLLLFDMWAKKSKALMITVLALTMNLVLPISGHAVETNQNRPQTQSTQTNQNKNTNTNRQGQDQRSTTSGKQPSADLPKTGPEAMLLLFALSSLAGSLAYRRFLLRCHDI